MYSRHTLSLLVLGDNDLLEHDKGEVGEGAEGHQDGAHQVEHPGRGQDSQPVKLKLFLFQNHHGSIIYMGGNLLTVQSMKIMSYFFFGHCFRQFRVLESQEMK